MIRLPSRSNHLRHALLGFLASSLAASCVANPEVSQDEPEEQQQGKFVPSTPANDTVTCAPTPAGSGSFGGKYYYRYRPSSGSISWMNAKAACESYGGKLAAPANGDENGAILNLASGREMWVGFFQPWNQTAVDANWQTVDGGSIATPNWGAGQPNDSDGYENNGQNCTYMFTSAGSDQGKWNDWPCYQNWSFDYVCEFSASPTCTGTATCTLPSGASTYQCTCGTLQQYSSTAGCVDVPSCTTDATYGNSSVCNSWDYNLTNRSSYIKTGTTGVLTGVQGVSIGGSGSSTYVQVSTTGIPNYSVTLSGTDISLINATYDADNSSETSDWLGSGTTVTADSTVIFGQPMGFKTTTGYCSYGFWPGGPVCPSDYAFVGRMLATPVAATSDCKQNIGAIGVWVSGAFIFGWSDANSWNNLGYWNRVAAKWEPIDMDICGGHAAQGAYHHHGNSACLRQKLGDSGTAHSAIYGYAADGYPVYGPWFASGTLAKSCWLKRDYDTMNGTGGCTGLTGTPGCGGPNDLHKRCCQLVDQTNVSAGVTGLATGNWGPTTTYSFVNSGHTMTTSSGAFEEDYYYDSKCGTSSVVSTTDTMYLDKHNGHSDSVRGYHYHVTMEASSTAYGGYVDVFPSHIGPTFAGQLTTQSGNGFASCK